MRFVTRILLIGSILFFCCGAGMAAWGWSEYKLGTKSTADPVEVDLAKLEAEGGKIPENLHLKIGPHYACYYSTVYSYRTKKKSPNAPDAKTSISYAFYPIVSKTNPDVKEWDELKKKHGSLDKLPDDVDLPLPTRFVVLVKTTKYKTIGAIPDSSVKDENGIQGLVINEVSSLTSEEKNLIKDEFPTIDFNKVLILEDGRKPSSTGVAILSMVIGVGILALGVLGVVGTLVLIIRGPSGGR